MSLPIQDEIRIGLSCLQKLIEKWNSIIEEAFTDEQEDRSALLETTLSSLHILETKFISDIDKLQSKVETQLKKAKKNKSIT